MNKHREDFTLSSFSVGNRTRCISNIVKKFPEVTHIYMIDKSKAKAYQKKYPHIVVYDIYKAIAALRMIKSKAEVDMIREAIATTELGLNNVLSIMGEAQYEYNLRNKFEYVAVRNTLGQLA